jgi:hypothetical protein
MEPRFPKTSEILKKAFGQQKKNEDDYVTLSEIMYSLHERGFAILILLFSLPSLIPVFQPPIPTLFAIPLAFFAFQMILMYDKPFLPQFVAKRRMKRAMLRKIVTKSLPLFHKLERFVRPRLRRIHSKRGEMIMGIFILVFSMQVAIPFPFTNLIPSIAMIFMAIGLISKDGVFTLFGMMLGTIYTIALFTYGKKGLAYVFAKVSAFFT